MYNTLPTIARTWGGGGGGGAVAANCHSPLLAPFSPILWPSRKLWPAMDSCLFPPSRFQVLGVPGTNLLLVEVRGNCSQQERETTYILKKLKI